MELWRPRKLPAGCWGASHLPTHPLSPGVGEVPCSIPWDTYGYTESEGARGQEGGPLGLPFVGVEELEDRGGRGQQPVPGACFNDPSRGER